MSKHKKTRQEKIISDLRHKLQIQNQITSSPETPTLKYEFKRNSGIGVKSNTIKFNNQQKTNLTEVKTYPYLIHDLLKTGILTLSIVILECLLLFSLKSHMLNLPGLNF